MPMMVGDNPVRGASATPPLRPAPLPPAPPHSRGRASLAIYDNAVGQPAIAAQLAKYGYPADRLTAERNQVQAFIDARRAQEAAKGAAQQATAAQDQAMTALDEEMRAFKKIAKVALKDAPKLLEKLGIPVRTTRTEAQRHAGAKAAATRKAKKQAKPEVPELVGAK